MRTLKDKFDVVDCYECLEKMVDAIKNKKIVIPDVVLLDLGLRTSQGYETFKKVLPIISDCCVIVLTGLGDEEIGKDAIRNGAFDFISKDDIFSDEICKRIGFSLVRRSSLAS